MPRSIAYIDMDGTVANLSRGFSTFLEPCYHPEDKPFNDMGEDVGYPPHIKGILRLIKNSPGFWANLDPIPLGFEIVEALRPHFELHVLTKGPKKAPIAWTEKVLWCEKYLPDVDVTVTLSDKGIVHGSVLVDDWPPYLLAFLSENPLAVGILPDQPWNRGWGHPRVLRVSSTEDVSKVVPWALRIG